MSNTVWIVHVTTCGRDHYYFAYKNKPTKEQVYKKHLIEEHDGEEDYEKVDCRIDIEKCEMIYED